MVVIHLMGVFFYLGREAGVGSLDGGIAFPPILALACAVGKLHLVLVVDQGAPQLAQVQVLVTQAKGP
jgi:hypothetical protein